MKKEHFSIKVILLTTVIFILSYFSIVYAQTPSESVDIQPKLTISIWPGVAPGSEDWTEPETDRGGTVTNVSEPTLIVYLPEESLATGTGVIVAPGGGFRFLSIGMEGHDVARWLVERGISAFVLKYRVMPSFSEDTDEQSKYGIADGTQAIKVVREHASEWGISPDRVGIVGFSAGAVVASSTVVHADPNARPDFAAPIYGGLLGDIDVPENLPPIFLAWAQDDDAGGRYGLNFYDALKAAGYNPELHLFSSGGHGFGMRKRGTSSDHWIDLFYFWMEANGWTRRAQ
ncbi:alpha/beta hydrolase [Planctomycetota bacterium]